MGLGIALVLSLAACGGGTAPSGESDPAEAIIQAEDVEEGSAPESAPLEEPAAPPQQDENPFDFKVGANGIMEGDFRVKLDTENMTLTAVSMETGGEKECTVEFTEGTMTITCSDQVFEYKK